MDLAALIRGRFGVGWPMSALLNRLRNMAARAVVSLVNDAARMQLLQIELLADETQDGVERFQDYGLTSVPHAGAEGLVLCVGGLRSHAIVIRVDDRRYRLAGLAEGEVALYDDLGQKVHLKRDGISIESPLKIEVVAPEVTVLADTISLGEGGEAVARVGDDVDLGTGKILSGSSKVKAA